MGDCVFITAYPVATTTAAQESTNQRNGPVWPQTIYTCTAILGFQLSTSDLPHARCGRWLASNDIIQPHLTASMDELVVHLIPMPSADLIKWLIISKGIFTITGRSGLHPLSSSGHSWIDTFTAQWGTAKRRQSRVHARRGIYYTLTEPGKTFKVPSCTYS